MSNPTTETVLGIPVQAVDVRIGDTDVCKRCYFSARPQCAADGILCHPDNRADRRNVYFIKIEEPEMLPTTKAQPTPAQPTAKQLSDRLLDLSQADNTTALLRKLLRQRAESTDYRLGLTLTSNSTTRKLVLRNLKTNTTTELETEFLRQAFEVHAEALLTTLLELHTQQVTAMKAELSDLLLETAVEYRK